MPHGGLYVDHTLFVELVHTVVDDAVSSAATHTGAAMNYDLLVSGRQFGPCLCVSDGQDEVENCLSTGWDAIVGPG